MKSVKIVIPSRGRSDTIVKQSLKLLPEAFVIVDEIEYDDYAKVMDKDRLLTHPSIHGITKICNYIIKLHPTEPIAMFGDDHTHLVAMPGWSTRRLKPTDVPWLLDNAAQCAADAGCGLWGFGRNANPIMYEPTRPWRIAQWITSPIGFVPGHGLKFDERLNLMADVDLSLQSLVKHRITWFDSRFCFIGAALNNRGGNAHMRSEEAFSRERAILKQKWGKFIRFDNTAVPGSARFAQGLPATTMMTYMNVPRTQATF